MTLFHVTNGHRLTPDFPPELVEFDALCLTRDVARRADTEYLLARALARTCQWRADGVAALQPVAFKGHRWRKVKRELLLAVLCPSGQAEAHPFVTQNVPDVDQLAAWLATFC